MYLHFSPSILIGYWASRKTLLEARERAMNKLASMGYDDIYGETVSLTKINSHISDSLVLKKWGKEGVLTIISTIFLTVFNLRNVLTLTLTRKVYNMLFSHQFIRFRYR